MLYNMCQKEEYWPEMVAVGSILIWPIVEENHS